MTTLSELLNLPRYNDLQFLTKYKGPNDTNINSIEISETPDIEHYIPNRTVLLTTGMIYQGDQSKLKSLIDSLIRAKTIGMGIKVNRFLGQIDDEIIKYADSKNFPIFKIPDHYNLGSLLHQWMDIVRHEKHEEIDFALDIQRLFQNLVVQDAPIQLYINEFSQMIRNPVILLDSFYEVITYSNHFKNQPDKVNDFIKQIRLQSVDMTDETHSYIVKDFDNNPIQIAVRELNIHNFFSEYLVILHPEQIPQPLNHFAMDQAALALNFVLLKNDKVHQIELTTEAEYFKDWIQEKFDFSQTHQYKYGFISSNYYQVIKVSDLSILNKQKEKSISHRETLWLIALWLEKSLSDISPQAKVIYSSSNLETLILLQEPIENLTAKLEKLANILEKRTAISIAYNVGSPVNSVNLIERSLTQARITHDERMEQSSSETVTTYENKGILHLFTTIDQQQVDFFIQNILGPFADLSNDSLSDLRETMYVYLSSQCEIAQTASKLYVHRNTVKYRIQKCEEILERDITEPEYSLNLRMALELLLNHKK
ncbi:PucR family transcriptional regulator [Aerococcaceae bacterium DSM 111020]|nr:PucR family transcriptional regulator [Aerococcaceae bacterium DSM 111020]